MVRSPFGMPASLSRVYQLEPSLLSVPLTVNAHPWRQWVVGQVVGALLQLPHMEAHGLNSRLLQVLGVGEDEGYWVIKPSKWKLLSPFLLFVYK